MSEVVEAAADIAAIVFPNPLTWAIAFATNAYGQSQAKRKANQERERALAAQRAAYNASLKDRLATNIAADLPAVYVYGLARVGSSVVAVLTSGARDEYKHLICIHAAHECDAFEEIYINKVALGDLDGDGFPVDGKYKTTIRIKKHLGAAADPADPDLIAEVPEKWTSDAVLRGYCYTYIRIDLNEQEFQSGLPAVEVLLRGKKLYDVRSATTAWSQNNALVIYDYLTSEMCGVDAADLPSAQFIAAANVCDETETFGNKYTFNGTVTAGQDQAKVLEQMAQSMAGSIVATTWDIQAGKYIAPVLALTQADIVGSVAITPGMSEADLYNGVRGQYISSETLYTATDFVPYQNAAYVAADGGELWTNIDFPFTDAVQRVHNLARIFTEDQRNGYTVKAGFSLKAWDLKIGQRVTLTSALFGWSGKVFRVTDKTYSPSSPVELTLKEDAASIWDYADEVVADATPNTGLSNPFIVPSPTGVFFTSGESELWAAGDGTLIPRIAVRWDRLDDVSVTRAMIRYRRIKGEDGYAIVPTPPFNNPIAVQISHNNDDPAYCEAWITGVTENETHEIAVAHVNALGIQSSWVTYNNVVAIASLPAVVQSVELTESLVVAAGAVVSKVHIKITATLARYYRVRWWRDDPYKFKLIERQFDSEFDIITDAEKDVFNIEVIPYRVHLGDIFNASIQLAGKSARPANVTGLQLSMQFGTAVLSCDPATDLDVIVGGYLVLRHSEQAGATWGTAHEIGLQPGTTTSVSVGLAGLSGGGAGAWFACWLDSSGNLSDTPASFVLSGTDVQAQTYKIVATLQQDTAWAGAKVGMAIDAGRLTLDGTWLSGSNVLGTYRAPTYDFGAIRDCGVKIARTISTYTTGAIDAKTSLIDAWEDIDGAVSDVTSAVYLRTTLDDPSSPSPAWSNWYKTFGGGFRARAFQVEVRVSSPDVTHNVYLDTLVISPWVPPILYVGADVVSAAGATAITFPSAFYESPSIAIVPQNMATGDYYEISSKSASGFTITFKTSAGAAVSRTFDWQATGY